MKKNSIDIQHSCLDPGVKRRDDGGGWIPAFWAYPVGG